MNPEFYCLSFLIEQVVSSKVIEHSFYYTGLLDLIANEENQ